MEKKLSEEILQIIKYPVCAINDCTVCKEKCDQILTAVKAYTEYVIGETTYEHISDPDDKKNKIAWWDGREALRIEQRKRAKEAL